MLEIPDAEEQEREVEPEEEQEEHDCGSQRAEQQERVEDEPSHEEEAEGIKEQGVAVTAKSADDVEARSKNNRLKTRLEIEIANSAAVWKPTTEIQKPPYEESAVAPKVSRRKIRECMVSIRIGNSLPDGISHMPARSWTRPP